MRAVGMLLMLLLLSSCDQTGIGVQSAVKNVLISPYRAAKSAIASSEYEDQKENTQKRMKELKQEIKDGKTTLECGPAHAPGGSAIEEIISIIDSKQCDCLAWGSCSKGICSCEKLCPNDFTIFHHPAGRPLKELSENANELAFRNQSGLSQYKEGNGYCWGHANVTAQFNRMAFFDKNKKSPFNIDSKNEEEQKQAIEYYKELIDKVTDNKATSIPGFENLRDLSDHPALQSFIADKAALNWADNAMTWQGLSVALTAGRRETTHYKKVFDQVKERLDMGLQPVIVYTGRNLRFQTHATLVSHYKETSEGLKLCLRDSRYGAHETMACRNYIFIDEDGKCQSSGSSEIAGLELAHNNDSDMVGQADELRRKCRADKNCKN